MVAESRLISSRTRLKCGCSLAASSKHSAGKREGLTDTDTFLISSPLLNAINPAEMAKSLIEDTVSASINLPLSEDVVTEKINRRNNFKNLTSHLRHNYFRSWNIHYSNYYS